MSVDPIMTNALHHINLAQKAVSTSSPEPAKSAALTAIAELLYVIAVRL